MTSLGHPLPSSALGIADEAKRVLSVFYVIGLFPKRPLASARAYMGLASNGAVSTIPEASDGEQRAALTVAAEAVGVHVLQLLPHPGVAALATAGGAPNVDGTPLPVDPRRVRALACSPYC
jgi:molecular chaperone DnaK (HSP70)